MRLHYRRSLGSIVALAFVLFFLPLADTVLASSGNGQVAAFDLKLVKRFFAIGTGSINGVYYPLGNAISRLFNSRFEDVVAMSESTQGAVANVSYLRGGDIALALMQNDVAFDAWRGQRAFEGRGLPQLRVLASLYSEVLQLVVHQDSPIISLSDLRGRHVDLGPRGSGTALNAQAVLDEVGLQAGDLRRSYSDFTKATDALQNGYVDAVFFTGGLPSEGISLLAQRIPIRVVGFPKEVRDALTGSFSYWSEEIIPAGTYRNQEEDVATVGLRALLTCTSDFPEETAENMLAVLFDNQTYLLSLTHVAKDILLLDALLGIEREMLHPGARSFYQKRSLLSE